MVTQWGCPICQFFCFNLIYIHTRRTEITVSKLINTSINLPDVTFKVLEFLAKRHGKAMSQIICDAIAREQVLQEAVDNGGKVLVKDKTGSLKQVVIR